MESRDSSNPCFRQPVDRYCPSHWQCLLPASKTVSAHWHGRDDFSDFGTADLPGDLCDLAEARTEKNVAAVTDRRYKNHFASRIFESTSSRWEVSPLPQPPLAWAG